MAKNHDAEDRGKQEISKTQKADFCFVIMPFGGWYDHYYRDIFRPAIEEAGLESRRADSLYRPSPIVHDIWFYTKEAKVILADLSGRNPNVLYELGLAHAITKPAILVVEAIEDIPFDLRSLRILEYDKNAPNWGDVLKQKITQAIKETLEEPLKSIPSAFLKVDESKVSKKVSPQDKEILEIRQELDLLKREVRTSYPPSGLPTGLIPAVSTTRFEAALMTIRRAVERNVPEDTIIEELAAQGYPQDWTRRKIGEMKGTPIEELNNWRG